MNIVRIFNIANGAVMHLPEPVGRGIFNLVGTVAGALPRKATKQLRRNQARLRPGMTPAESRALARSAMRSYMRYYYEALRIARWSKEEILARVVVESGVDEARRHLEERGSLAAALLHSANWDLAGAFAGQRIGPVHTLAEKLEPEDLFRGFMEFRESLGMTVYPVVKGGGAIHKLEADMREGRVFTPLVADRDLTHTGLEVHLGEGIARVAAGPAILAVNTGEPIVAVALWYQKAARREGLGTRWRMHVHITEPIEPRVGPEAPAAEKQAEYQRLTEAWVSALEPFLREHLEDWHMLQPLFLEDLDQDRLAKSRAKAAARMEAERRAES